MKRTITIVAFGDSITLAMRQPEEKKWISLLESKMKSAYPEQRFLFVNAGAGGNTTREGLARMDTDVLRHHPDYVIVEFGGNDPAPVDGRFVSLSEYRANLERMREKIVAGSGADMLVCTFPPVIDVWHVYGDNPFFRKWGGFDACVEEYRNATREFAEKYGCVLVDLEQALRNRIRQTTASDYILPDGVHLTERGNVVVAETVFTHLELSGKK